MGNGAHGLFQLKGSLATTVEGLQGAREHVGHWPFEHVYGLFRV